MRVLVVRSAAPDIQVGDVIHCADGHELPLRANASELEGTLHQTAPCDGVGREVVLGLWRAAPEAFLGIGTEVAVRAKSASSLGVDCSVEKLDHSTRIQLMNKAKQLQLEFREFGER